MFPFLLQVFNKRGISTRINLKLNLSQCINFLKNFKELFNANIINIQCNNNITTVNIIIFSYTNCVYLFNYLILFQKVE